MNRASLKGRKVALGVGGGIAAYKACEVLRELQRSGAEVRVAMTQAATQFIAPLTFQSLSGHPVLTDYFDPAQEGTFGHLDLARWADLYILAPATADLLARVTAGMGNDAVTTSLLAFKGPVLLAPAMNVAMWENPITQRNLETLARDPRYRTAGPGSGLLACGDIGQGRLAEPEEIVDAAAQLFEKGPLSGKRILITAGPTREYLDPVRFLSNPSTGKMGLALAEAAASRGAQVTVVLGPTGETARGGFEVVGVTTAEEMRDAVLARLNDLDFLVAAAAVSDWKPKQRHPHKRKKTEEDGPLELVRTPDVLAEASARAHQSKRRPYLVGFAAETERVVENALSKLVAKNLDAMVANEVGGKDAGFAADTNRVVLLFRGGERREISGAKREVAHQLWEAILSATPSSEQVAGTSR